MQNGGKMLSFKTIDEILSDGQISKSEKAEQFLEKLRSLSESDELSHSELLVSISHGCAVGAVFEASAPVVFFYPSGISDAADESRALLDITEYCIESECTERITDVPCDKLASALRGATHAEVEYIGGDAYVVTLISECSLLEYTPELMEGSIYLCGPEFCFADEYKRLLLYKSVNLYTGYDVRSEMQSADAKFFVEEAIWEQKRGKALTLFATILSESGENVFIGESVIYSFDCRGSAEISIRLLPEFMGRGYGAQLLSGAMKIAEQIGIFRVFMRVLAENTASVKLASKLMDLTGESNGTIIFSRTLFQNETQVEN